ncbi:MAG: hypothetical protein ABIH41_07100 [Nanoarchaeota archaeon]
MVEFRRDFSDIDRILALKKKKEGIEKELNKIRAEKEEELKRTDKEVEKGLRQIQEKQETERTAEIEHAMKLEREKMALERMLREEMSNLSSQNAVMLNASSLEAETEAAFRQNLRTENYRPEQIYNVLLQTPRIEGAREYTMQTIDGIPSDVDLTGTYTRPTTRAGESPIHQQYKSFSDEAREYTNDTSRILKLLNYRT